MRGSTSASARSASRMPSRVRKELVANSAEHHRIVAREHRLVAELPDAPAPRRCVSMITEPPISPGSDARQDRHHRDQRVAQHVHAGPPRARAAPWRAPSGCSPGARSRAWPSACSARAPRSWRSVVTKIGRHADVPGVVAEPPPERPVRARSRASAAPPAETRRSSRRRRRTRSGSASPPRSVGSE